MNKAPAFQFYPADFLSDANVAMMDPATIGAYILLICYCWNEDGIPKDIKKLARLSRMNEQQFDEAWVYLSECFVPHADDTKLDHPRLQKEREKQEINRIKKSEAAGMRWGKQRISNAGADNKSSISNAGALQMECLSSPSSTSKKSPLESPQGDRAKKAFCLPKDWEPNQELLTWALDKYPTVETRQQTERFKNHFIANGKRMVDWDRAWQNWIARSLEFGKPITTAAEPKKNGLIQRIMSAKDVEINADGDPFWVSGKDLQYQQGKNVFLLDGREYFVDQLSIREE